MISSPLRLINPFPTTALTKICFAGVCEHRHCNKLYGCDRVKKQNAPLRIRGVFKISTRIKIKTKDFVRSTPILVLFTIICNRKNCEALYV
jgi:hypothetical protein